MDFSFLYPPVVFVHLALLFYVLGFLNRDALVLRLLVLCGSGFYILYYYNVSETPLWDAILASVAIGLANIYGAIRIATERSTIGMKRENAEVFSLFPTMNPGQFRKIAKIAEFVKAEQDTTLCHQGERPARVYLILDQSVRVQKDDHAFLVPAGNFIGELSFLLDQPATATVTAPEGTRYMAWDPARLKRLMRGSTEISNAMIALFNADLSRKLSISAPKMVHEVA